EGERVATASEDRTVRIWRRDQPRITKILRGHQGPLVAASFDAEGERVLTASLDGTARLWSVDGEASPIVFRHGQELIFTAFETPGNRIVTASEASIRIWRADGTGEPLTIATEGPGFDAIALAESGIATATWDGQLRIWQLEQGAKAMPDSPVELGRLESAVLALAWDPRGRRLAAAAQDGSVHIWPSVSEPAQVLGRHQGAVEKVAFSPNGRSLVSSGKDNAARVWRLDGSREPMTLRGHQRAVRFADFSPNASQVATASDDDTVRVWQLDQLDTPRALTWHRDDVTVVRFSPDGRLLVSASKDGAALLWRLDGSGEPLVLWHRDAHGVPARVTAAEFSPEGTHLVTASLDHTARIWLIDTATLRGEIAATVQGCLDAEFRRSYLGETEAQARRAFARCAGQNSLTRRPAADGDGIQSSPSAPPGDS
ncbi:MAG: WD40 repeat domain-containing protein, partial [Acidobacteriota bacterium]